MNVAVIGSRTFNNYSLMKETLDKLDIKLIVSGGAYGADKLGERYAKVNDIKTRIFLPEWSKYGKKAGIIRNKLIVSNSDIVVAFWDGSSRGTLSSINMAKNSNKQLLIIK